MIAPANVKMNIVLAYSWREIRRQISKTTSVTNSDSMSPRLDGSSIAWKAADDNKGGKKMLNLQKYHRFLSTLNSNQVPLVVRGTAASKDDSREFMAVFPDLVRDLTETGKHLDVPEASKWIAKVLQYNVTGGKRNRGLATVLAYKMLEKPENITSETIRLANIMGWCVEMFQAYLLVLDDMMDGSAVRRGVPCWYRQAGVGRGAINDALLIQASLGSVLKKHFRAHSYYPYVLEMFNEMLLKTAIGQHLDMSTNNSDKPDLSKFTMDRYNAIVKYKTAYYTFQMPISLALLMTGQTDPETHRQAKTILLEMGQFFQIQDDFLDCFGEPSVTGKNGTDIQEGKCTWLAVVALQRANPSQKAVIEEYLGSDNPEHVQKVKNLYEELGLPHTYSVYEEASYNLIKTHIQQITRGLPHELFFKILDKIYRRES